MHGVPLGNIDVINWNATRWCKVSEYLANFQTIDLEGPGYTNYTELKARAESARDASDPFRKKPRGAAGFPPNSPDYKNR